MDEQHPIIDLIDQALMWDEAQQDPFRGHLGGSMIGRPCDREIWYGFHWARRVEHSGRMLRLLNRGHREEERFVGWLRRIGAKVSDVDENGKQHRIIDVDGHFGGSLDGIATNMPGIDPNEEVLLEFKTHNTKSFIALINDRVAIAKPVHHAQMQVYMYKRGLRLALYMAINKNDDSLYAEWVEAKPHVGEFLIEKARRIIHAPGIPDRIANSPAWHQCKFCDFKAQCHFAAPMGRNCRTCRHARPVEDGQWHCSLWNANIPLAAQYTGCDNWVSQTD